MRKSKLISLFMCMVLIMAVNVYANEDSEKKLENELLLEQDDFVSQEEYEEYLEKHPDVKEQQYTETPENSLITRATPNTTGSATASHVYDITGLPSQNAIQKTYIATDYVYVVQRSGTTWQNTGAAEKTLESNGFVYKIIGTDVSAGNKHIEITDYIGKEEHIVFPKEIAGLPVKALTADFSCIAPIKSVTVTDNIDSYTGLTKCETLEEIILDDSCTRFTVKDGILYSKDITVLLCYPSAKKNTEYVVPETVTDELYSTNLSNAKNLKKITFNKIILSCFGNDVESVKISDDIKKIPENAFAFCKKLKTVEMGKGITLIAKSAFQSCTSLKSIKFPKGLQTIMGDAFSGCSKLTTVKLPSTLHRVGNFAFDGTKIKKVTIPKSVDSIGYNAFPRKTKLNMPSYFRKTVNPWAKKQISYRAYVTTKSGKKMRRYRASKVTKITSKRNVRLKKGSKYAIKTRVFVSGKKKAGVMKNDILKFSSSNSKIVKVTGSGKIKALKKGKATITVSMRTSYKKYKVRIRVK